MCVAHSVPLCTLLYHLKLCAMMKSSRVTFAWVAIFFLPAVAIIIIVLEHQCWNMILLKSEKYQSAQQGDRVLVLFGQCPKENIWDVLPNYLFRQRRAFIRVLARTVQYQTTGLQCWRGKG